MDTDTITHVRTSWHQVEAIAPTAAAMFYDNLFSAQPPLRALFKHDMPQQGDKLMQMIGAAVARLDDLPALVPVLQQLAVRHAGYGVCEEHYEMVGAALLKTLAQGLADGFTPAVRAAWMQVYGLVSATMIAAANDALGTEAPPRAA
jgi:hemoglobin-like flavoprotein